MVPHARQPVLASAEADHLTLELHGWGPPGVDAAAHREGDVGADAGRPTARNSGRIDDRDEGIEVAVVHHELGEQRRVVAGCSGGRSIGGLGEHERPHRAAPGDSHRLGRGEQSVDGELRASTPHCGRDRLGSRLGSGAVGVGDSHGGEADARCIEPRLGGEHTHIDQGRPHRCGQRIERSRDHLAQQPVGHAQRLIGEQRRTRGDGNGRLKRPVHRSRQQMHHPHAGVGQVDVRVGAVAGDNPHVGHQFGRGVGVQVERQRDRHTGADSPPRCSHEVRIAAAVERGERTVQAQHQRVEWPGCRGHGCHHLAHQQVEVFVEQRTTGHGMGIQQRHRNPAEPVHSRQSAREFAVGARQRCSRGVARISHEVA